MGLNQGMQPIAGYNFGARQFHRVNHVMKLTVIAATIVTSTGFLVGELIPELAVSAFTTDSKLIEVSARTPNNSHVLPDYRIADGNI